MGRWSTRVVTLWAGGAPQAGNPEALASVHYRYADARVQAGGRGWLGFAEIVSFDPNHRARGGAWHFDQSAFRRDIPQQGIIDARWPNYIKRIE